MSGGLDGVRAVKSVERQAGIGSHYNRFLLGQNGQSSPCLAVAQTSDETRSKHQRRAQAAGITSPSGPSRPRLQKAAAVCWVDSSISGRRVWGDYGFTSHLSPIPPASQGSHPRRSTQSDALLHFVPVGSPRLGWVPPPSGHPDSRHLRRANTWGPFGVVGSPLSVRGKRYPRLAAGSLANTCNAHTFARTARMMQRRTQYAYAHTYVPSAPLLNII